MKHSNFLKAAGSLSYTLAAAFLVAALVIGLLPVELVAASKGGNSGAIWTTNGDCGDASQDVNHFAIGEVVYINGSNFDPNTSYSWQIKGQPGGASADPNIVVASGTVTTDSNGNFCFAAYTVAADDDGEYSVKVGNKGDNYRVRGTTPPPPPPPVDVCPNIQGNQTTVPAGMEVDGQGNCVPIIDLCPNIAGNQAAIPVGMEMDNEGNCVPIVDLCPNIDGNQSYLPDGMEVDDEGNCVPVSSDDPFGLDFYCLGFTVTNQNDFAASFDWEVAGGPSGSETLGVGESIDIDVDPAFADALVTISFGDGEGLWSLSGSLPEDCPLPFEELTIEGFCLGPNAESFGWRIINPNGYDVDVEWRVNGSALAGLATVDANSNHEFSTPKAEGSIIMLYIGGVFQGDATGAQNCPVDREIPPPPPGGDPGETPIIPLGSGGPILIPVTGAADDLVDLTPRLFMNLGFGFFGLGLVLHGLGRRKSVL